MDAFHQVLAQLPRRWENDAALPLALALAAGPILARRARVLSLHHRVLALAAADASTRVHLLSVAPELVRTLNQILGDGRILRLNITLEAAS